MRPAYAGLIPAIPAARFHKRAAAIAPKHETCMPDDVVLAETQAGVIGFLRDNPELLDFGAAGLVKKALVLKYPCTKKL